MVRKLAFSALVLVSVAAAAQTFNQDVPLSVQRPPSSAYSSIQGTIAEWSRLRQSDGYSFGDYARFLRAHPGFPGEEALRKAAELRIDPVMALPAEVVGFFAAKPPLTAVGQLRYAEALAATGRRDQANMAARAAWTMGLANPLEEQRLTTRFAGALTPADHDARMEALLGQKLASAAVRGLGWTSPGRRAIFDARIALQQNASDAASRVAALGGAGSGDPGLLVDRARWLRTSGQSIAARGLLASPRTLTRSVQDPLSWIETHVLLGRAAAADRQWTTAYRIATALLDAYPAGTDVSLESFDERDEYTNLAWIGGTAALHHMGRPADAVSFFERYGRAARSPQTLTKGLYWAGRAASAAGETARANALFTEAGTHFDQFYGQLALERLGRPLPVPPTADGVVITPAQEASFQRRELVQAARQLGLQGQWRDQSLFLRTLAMTVESQEDRLLAARLATQIGRPDLGVMVGREARNDGVTMYKRWSFPTTSVPASEVRNWTMIHAIARQESQFDRQAVSHAGARGLMQLMPGTAREQAGKLGLPYDMGRLTSDTSYNIMLGSDYFSRMLDYWGGNHVLAVASYNAGAGNVRKWINANGDPRLGGADIVRWIEEIPIFETKNYVQRVLENAVVYNLLNPSRAQMRQQNQLSAYLGKNRPG